MYPLRADKRGIHVQRLKSKGLVIATFALLVLTFFASLTQASSYSGYDDHSIWLDGIKLQEWELWVRIEKLPTDLNDDGIVNILDILIVSVAFGATPSCPNWDSRADLDNNGIVNILDVLAVSVDYGLCHHWNIKWKTSGSYPYTPVMYCWYLSYVEAWDDKGFSWKLKQIGLDGEVTLYHSNLYTWTYTKIVFAYMLTPFIYDYITLKVGIYVET